MATSIGAWNTYTPKALAERKPVTREGAFTRSRYSVMSPRLIDTQKKDSHRA